MDSTDKAIQIYGDESHSQGMITYAFIIVPHLKLTQVESEIVRIKNEYGFQAGDQIHCKHLMHDDPRKKTPFKDMSKDEIFVFLLTLLTAIFLAGARGWVGYLANNKAPDILLFEEEGTGKRETWDIRDIKLKMLFTYRAAIAPISHFTSVENLHVCVDGDSSMVTNLGNSKEQIDRMKRFFPIDDLSKTYTPEAFHKNKPMLLEMADVLAYSAAQGLSETLTRNKQKFIDIVNAIKPGYSEVIIDKEHPGGAMMAVRAHDRDDLIKTYVKSFI